MVLGNCFHCNILFNMATVYKVEVVSHWVNYSEEELEKILIEAIKKIELDEVNHITIEVKERK